jgi:hypothetical protein
LSIDTDDINRESEIRGEFLPDTHNIKVISQNSEEDLDRNTIHHAKKQDDVEDKNDQEFPSRPTKIKANEK